MLMSSSQKQLIMDVLTSPLHVLITVSDALSIIPSSVFTVSFN